MPSTAVVALEPMQTDAAFTLKPMRVPVAPDPVELERLLVRLSVLVELRADPGHLARAQNLLSAIQAEVDLTLDSPMKHREWKVRRYRVLELLTQLDEALYYQLP